MKKHKYDFIDIRIFVVLIAFGLLYSFLGYRLYDLQVNKKYFSKINISRGKRIVKKDLNPQRGMILDTNGNILALTRKVKSMYCVPGQVENKEETARKLSSITGLEYDHLFSRMTKKSYFSWLKRKLEDEEYQYIEKHKFPGIGFREEYQRFYPKGEVFCHILGFVNIDNKGLEGMERYMEKHLKGIAGTKKCEIDAQGNEILSYTIVENEPFPGDQITLTIDEVIQEIVNEELDKVIEKHNPVGAVAIVMESNTGNILAMCSKPSFAPKSPGKFKPAARRNRAITDMYEPGSVFKIITTAAALNEKVVDINDVFFCEQGAYRIARHTLHDSHPYGDLTVKEIISKSSNIGAAKIADMVEDDIFYKYIRHFGFGSRTGIRLPGEANGLVHSPSKWSRLSKPSLAMGHEILVTTLQMITAVNVIASGGYYLEPGIIKNIKSDEGKVLYKREKREKRILSKQTVFMMREALKEVVSENGTAIRAKLEKYLVAGKTGTAQKLNENGRYSHSKFVGSFVGFVPADDPQITILVVVDEPRKNGYYGGTVAAPAFSVIADKILKYLHVFKDRNIYVEAVKSSKKGS
ncbi:MAG: penicillin-binding protein 2 [Candidatus Aureabacteria bacterium]|nr:penicillin-binding protein 2 [Candidatus Auribacterota bacterium]